MDRDSFAERQAEMTATWFRNLQARVGDVTAYIAGRQRAYLDRWQEAARFIPDGARVLDIGGGNLYADLLRFFQARRFDYHYLDADPAAVAASRELAVGLGFDGRQFQQGLNDRFDHPDASFDAIFSSHCVEHSIALRETLIGCNRLLRPGGNALIAVPLGWESNPEHPYFLDTADWQALIADAGFELRVMQLGREYPEQGLDLFIAARKHGAPGPARLDPEDYRKENFRFEPLDSGMVRLDGVLQRAADYVILDGPAARIDITAPAAAQEVLPVLSRHDWSGRVALRWGASGVLEDLYSWHSYVQPVRIARGDAANRVSVTPAGRHPASHGGQMVLWGVLWR
jgi:SAM-dependent methyltransferase